MGAERYNVGIVGWWYNLNYGGTLTYYSLNKCIEKMGLSVLMIQKSDNDILHMPTDSVPTKFARKHYNISQPLSFNQMGKLNEICDNFVVGSDQLWNPNLMKYSGRQYFLSFAESDKNKISYATSLGDTTKCSDEFVSKFKKYLQKFGHISVREDFAVDVLKNDLDVSAECVCDPIFLNGRGIFDELSNEAVQNYPKQYVLNFLLDPNEEKINACKFIRDKLNINEYVNFTNLQNVEENVNKFAGEYVYSNAEIEELVKAYKNAEFIVTDSFHGTCLAIIFNKPFISFANRKRGQKRFVSLLKEIGLMDRLVFEINQIYQNNDLFSLIDYTKVNNIIENKRRQGLEWLKQALDIKPKTVANSNISCTGCSACSAICPANAITMYQNKDGFWVPQVDNEKCINCGLCVKKCIAKNPIYSNASEPECYALMADTETRMKSSSGGAFSIVAEYIIDNGGYVCGASYTKEFAVKHIIINKKEELYKLRGSKYMQSEIGDIFLEIKKLLNNGKLVLFTGMPCQVAGLYSFLGKDCETLYSIDLLCHGITSSKVFEKYHSDILGNKEITKLEFKAKEPWGWHAGVNAYFKDGSKYSQPLEKDFFFISYLKSISKNIACGECTSNKLPRQGDITIGDFWGINKCDPEMFDNKGTSVVLLNNAKAQDLFHAISGQVWKIKEEKLLDAIRGNQPIKSPFRMHRNRDNFFEHLDTVKFDLLTIGCRDNNLSQQQIKALQELIPVEEHYLYYLAKIAAENANGRKIVTWTGMPAFNRILKQFFNKEVAFSVAQNAKIIDNISIFNLSSLSGRRDEFYIVAIHPEYTASKYKLLEDMGYYPVKDFVFRTPKPIVLERYNTNVRYEDEYGNTIEGYSNIIGKIIFRGCNNHIHLGESVKNSENLVIDVVANSNIQIKKDCAINDKVLIEVKGVVGYSKLVINEACRISNALFRIYNNYQCSSVEIGEHCTFERNLEVHANSGKKILIGEDCMFSHDIDLWAGDGHSIFDIETGKNINSGSKDDSDISNKIVIGNHVWIAKGVFIMHGTVIGPGSIVGARSVVKKRFPNNCSIAGNPAKVVKKNIAWGRDQVATNMYLSCGEKNVNYTEE